MPQGPLAATIASNYATGQQAPGKVGPDGTLMTSQGGQKSLLNQSAAVVVKATPGRLAKVVIIAPGTTSGAWTFNDCATTGAAAASNEIWNLPYNATNNVAGAVIDLNLPCATGIVLSAVPGAGSPVIAIFYS